MPYVVCFFFFRVVVRCHISLDMMLNKCRHGKHAFYANLFHSKNSIHCVNHGCLQIRKYESPGRMNQNNCYLDASSVSNFHLFVKPRVHEYYQMPYHYERLKTETKRLARKYYMVYTYILIKWVAFDITYGFTSAGIHCMLYCVCVCVMKKMRGSLDC